MTVNQIKATKDPKTLTTATKTSSGSIKMTPFRKREKRIRIMWFIIIPD